MRPTFPRLSPTFRPLPTLPSASLPTFRAAALHPALPHTFPPSTFASLPAISHWFAGATLNPAPFASHAAHPVTLEFSSASTFRRATAPLGLFVSWLSLATGQNPAERLVVAQSSLSSLPEPLKADVPAPEVVTKAGKGDVYDSSLWLGLAPTVTPLHRDPNPNVLVQLAGVKVVRLLDPSSGKRVWERAVRRAGGSGREGTEGMMNGGEREALEEEVWGGAEGGEEGWEATIKAGDGVFIPTGWWHAVRGVGEGVTGSVNWWFR